MNKKILESARIIFIVLAFILITVSEFDVIYLRLFRGEVDVKNMLVALNLAVPLRNLALIFAVSSILSRGVRGDIVNSFLKMFTGRYLFAMFFLTSIFFIITLYTAYVILDYMPHTGDESAYLFQARIFSEGRLSWDAPPYRYLIDPGISILSPGRIISRTLVSEGRWYIRSAPGYPFFLMFGVLLNQPWIINPIFGVLFLIVLFYIGKEAYDVNTSLLAVLLGSFSPFVILISASFFSHVSTLFFISLFVYFLIKSLKTPTFQSFLITAISLGVAFNIRPLTAVGASFPLVLYLFYHSIRRRTIRHFLVFLSGLLFFVFLFFLYNGTQTGWEYPTIESQMFAIYGGGFGFKGDYYIPSRIHTPQKAVAIVNVTHQALNKFVFLWPVPALLFVLILFVSESRNRWDYLLLSSHLGLVGAYFFWYSTGVGPGYGPRFQYESMCVLLLLSARGILLFPSFLSSFSSRISVDSRILSFVFIALILLINMYSLPSFLQGYKNHRGYGWYVRDFVENELSFRGVDKAIVLLPSPMWDFVCWNSLVLSEDVIYGVDLDSYYGASGKTKELVSEYFPDRACFKLKFNATWLDLEDC